MSAMFPQHPFIKQPTPVDIPCPCDPFLLDYPYSPVMFQTLSTVFLTLSIIPLYSWLVRKPRVRLVVADHLRKPFDDKDPCFEIRCQGRKPRRKKKKAHKCRLQMAHQMPRTSSDTSDEVVVKVLTKNRELVLLSKRQAIALPHIWTYWKIARRKHQDTVYCPSIIAKNLRMVREVIDHIHSGADRDTSPPSHPDGYTLSELVGIVRTMHFLRCNPDKFL
ncbi:hypothetical protein QR680_000504 [Steinernema hermaphroditum]|uniref:Uncharacterized protein n=1 Tax=Steinernema hermaphroditum TaxID=289476 RepID=A0AA39GV06_9BILA|nr:hypothetical protein QR680_000504 [Steinernema hermaphroditum]